MKMDGISSNPRRNPEKVIVLIVFVRHEVADVPVLRPMDRLTAPVVLPAVSY
jgi:hypothetical protein